MFDILKKSLKMPKRRKTEAVNRRMTDDTMTKKKKDKRTKNDPQNTTQKTKH
jgi:hypothetical protein